jgi:hypothetical protein
MCLICQTELCQKVTLNLHWVEESQVQKMALFRRNIGLDLDSRRLVTSVVGSSIAVFRWCVYASWIDVVILAHAADYIVLRAPWSSSYYSVLSIDMMFTCMVISVKNIWTRAESSCGRVILEAATHGARVAPAESRSVRQLDHSRNVKLDFPDEHLPKFKWYILQFVEYISGGSETSPPTKILHRTFCFNDY